MTTHRHAARATDGLAGLFGRLFSPCRLRTVRHYRVELDESNDHMLRDIGLSRGPTRLYRRD
ncbi:hypothetical protein [Mesorhizobium sp. CN2-181]|uniref:hypothetical protein n=1 Tax=Mesorhizobium yinganensis TaxID=3157707 RepID=UPI0032B7AF8E